ncbi:MAG TPA: hypothetical protein VKN99_18285 [Polyangia bacterium]|nr:hypothetical protein [Polyangia bacterium]
MSQLWTAEEALQDLAALDGVLAELPERERAVVAACWFADRYGPDRGAAVFVLFVRLARYLARHALALAGRERDPVFLGKLLFALGAGGPDGAVASVPAEVPPEDVPEG